MNKINSYCDGVRLRHTFVCFFIGLFISVCCEPVVVLGNTRVQTQVYLPVIRRNLPSTVVINELLTLNGAVNYNQETTEFDDWIELYNPTANRVDLSGYGLSDNTADLDKWRLPSGTQIAPFEHLLIWAVGDDLGGLQANFKLSDNGETITLSRPDGTVVDRDAYGEQAADMTDGRLSDGDSQLSYFGSPTPGTANRNGRSDQERYDRPTVDILGGFYDNAQTIVLSSTTGTTIRYTTDGSTPTQQSPRYTAPLVINETTVVKMRAYGQALHSSPIVANTYLIDESSQLPTISIGVNPDYFFDDQIGIYVEGTNGVADNCVTEPSNWHQDWERPITIEMYEPDGTRAFEENAGIKIHGGCSRYWSQKSLAIRFRDKYGDDTINYPVFLDGDVHKHHSLILRNFGQTWRRALMRDAVAQAVLATEMDWDGQRTRPAVVYVNGVYWGMHNIREKLNADYIEEHHGYDKDAVDILEENQAVIEGNNDPYRALINYIDENDLRDADAYNYVTTQIDVDQYIDYQIGQIYFDNKDWPDSNIKYWRPRVDGGQWRWLTFDMDMTFNWWDGWDDMGERNSLQEALEDDGDGWPNPGWSTYLFRSMMKNQAFRDQFLQRFSLYLDHTFAPDHVKTLVDAHAAIIEDEVDAHLDRWESTLTSVEQWRDEVGQLRAYADARPPIMRRHLESYFSVDASRTAVALRVEAGAGTIEINTVRVTDATHTAYLYPDKPITLRGIPAAGYRFVRWEGAVNSTERVLTVQVEDGLVIKAIFEPAPQPVINEIHYNPSSALQGEDALYEFIELYNPHDEAIDMSGYEMTDGIEFVFPAGSLLPPDGYVVLAQSADNYSDLDVPVYQWTAGGLKNGGEQIELSSADGSPVDAVTYDDEGEWVILPDGDGPSLTLIAATLDNQAAASWQASTQIGGTPGAPND